MRSEQDVNKAIDTLAKTLLKKKHGVTQGHLLMGMVVALAWVRETGGSTLQDLIDGRPMETEAPIEDSGEILEAIKRRCGGK